MAQYTRNPPLSESDLDADPMQQLQRWIDVAADAGMIEPTAMTLATADATGRPSARMVLFKGFVEAAGERHPTFYTNYDSDKGRDLAANPRAALVFWWDRLERQVRIEGTVTRVSRALSEAYFRRRPRPSQLAALVSQQSQPVASREALDARMAEAEARYRDGEVPCPEYWGGYALAPLRVEFWQGRGGRAHDRLLYHRSDDSGPWQLVRLQP